MKRAGIIRKLCTTVLIAIGVGIVWGIVTGWGLSIVEAWMRTDYVYESLEIRRDGTVVISSRSNRNYDDATYRTLEGQSVEVRPDESLQAATLRQPPKSPSFFEPGIGWGESLGGSDFRRPAVDWYLIRNNERLGRAYFIGYDESSRMAVGYISRSGFRRSLPPEDDWFDVGLHRFEWGTGVAASTGYMMPNAPANSYNTYAETAGIPSWLVYLIDGERLLEIDLRNRSVRTVEKSADIVSVGILMEAKPTADDGGEQSPQDRNVTARLAIRTADRIIVMDPTSDKRREFPVPEPLRDQLLSAYSLSNGQLLLVWHINDERRETRLMWIDEKGDILREESPQLAQYIDPLGPRVSAIVPAGIAPIPAGWYLGVGVVAPLVTVASGSEPTYAAALAKVLGMSWIALLIVTAVGCVSAWLVWRWQHRYHRTATGLWCTFAFLIGLPAVIAYWLEQRRAKLESCTQCEKVVPRDRETCAACDVAFPTPPLVGTEILA